MKNDVKQSLKAFSKMMESLIKLLQTDSEIANEAYHLGFFEDIHSSLSTALKTYRDAVDKDIEMGKISDSKFIERYQEFRKNIEGL